MTKKQKWIRLVIIGMAITAFIVGATAAFAASGQVESESFTQSNGPGPNGFGRHGGFGDQSEFLADALGISVDELQAAQQAAKEAAVQQALDEGLITQEQADRMLAGEGRGFGPGGRGFHGPRDSEIDYHALLADALGISVEELEAAQQEAKEAALQQALDDGVITQEQLDLMEARSALKDYLDHESMMADILGLSVEELQAAREDGQSMQDLLDEAGLDQAAFMEAIQAARTEAIEQAVDDDVITQAQADLLQSETGPGLHGPGFGGRGGFDGHRGPRDNARPENLPNGDSDLTAPGATDSL
jgi:hypothetical protein